MGEHRDYLDKLALKLLEKETLRRPDLEAIFDGIDPQRVDIFDTDVRFPQQAGFEPVKTPTELAKERGEEPPKRLSLLEASLLARERRQAAQKDGADEHAVEEGEIGLIFGDNNAVGVTGLPKLEAAEQTGKHRKDGPGHEQNDEQGRENKDD